MQKEMIVMDIAIQIQVKLVLNGIIKKRVIYMDMYY